MPQLTHADTTRALMAIAGAKLDRPPVAMKPEVVAPLETIVGEIANRISALNRAGLGGLEYPPLDEDLTRQVRAARRSRAAIEGRSRARGELQTTAGSAYDAEVLRSPSE